MANDNSDKMNQNASTVNLVHQYDQPDDFTDTKDTTQIIQSNGSAANYVKSKGTSDLETLMHMVSQQN